MNRYFWVRDVPVVVPVVEDQFLEVSPSGVSVFVQLSPREKPNEKLCPLGFSNLMVTGPAFSSPRSTSVCTSSAFKMISLGEGDVSELLSLSSIRAV